MDYSGFKEFPFPSQLSEDGKKVRDYFMDLTDEEQLGLLNGSASYNNFYQRVIARMNAKRAAAH